MCVNRTTTCLHSIQKYVLLHELGAVHVPVKGNCPKPSIENGTRQPEEIDENQPEEDDEKN